MAEIKVCDGSIEQSWDREPSAPAHGRGELVRATSWVMYDSRSRGPVEKHQCRDHLRQTVNAVAQGWLSNERDELRIVIIK